MHFCLLSQPALYLVSSLLGQVRVLLFFQGMMAHCLPPRSLFCVFLLTASTHEAVHVFTWSLGLAVHSGHVTGPLCFLGYHCLPLRSQQGSNVVPLIQQDSWFCCQLYSVGN